MQTAPTWTAFGTITAAAASDLGSAISLDDGTTYMAMDDGSLFECDTKVSADVWITHSKGGIPGAIAENLEGA
jgi:hypothetical protein